MKKISILLFFSLFCTILFGQQTKGTTIESLIPSGWEVLSEAIGDLNKDGMPDLAIVLERKSPETIWDNLNPTKKIGETKARILAIYFKNKNTKEWELQTQSDNFIIRPNLTERQDWFSEIKITKRGALQVKFEVGEVVPTLYTYTFRYQNSWFELIGFDYYERHRASGLEKMHSINFSIRKMQTKTIYNDDRADAYQEEWRPFELKELKSLETLHEPFQWRFLGLQI